MKSKGQLPCSNPFDGPKWIKIEISEKVEKLINPYRQSRATIHSASMLSKTASSELACHFLDRLAQFSFHGFMAVDQCQLEGIATQYSNDKSEYLKDARCSRSSFPIE